MRSKDRELARKMIAEEGWNELGIIHENPGPLFWGKEVRILYEDMDGQLCSCQALDTFEEFRGERFTATTGPAKGNIMSNVVAWKELEEKKPERKVTIKCPNCGEKMEMKIAYNGHKHGRCETCGCSIIA